jgi:hypothetical protein
LAASVAGPRAENRDAPWRVTDNPVFSGRKLLECLDLRQLDVGIATLSQKAVAKPYASKFAAGGAISLKKRGVACHPDSRRRMQVSGGFTRTPISQGRFNHKSVVKQ